MRKKTRPLEEELLHAGDSRMSLKRSLIEVGNRTSTPTLIYRCNCYLPLRAHLYSAFSRNLITGALHLIKPNHIVMDWSSTKHLGACQCRLKVVGVLGQICIRGALPSFSFPLHLPLFTFPLGLI